MSNSCKHIIGTIILLYVAIVGSQIAVQVTKYGGDWLQSESNEQYNAFSFRVPTTQLYR